MKMMGTAAMAAVALIAFAATASAQQSGDARMPMTRTAEGSPMAPGRMMMQDGMMGQMNDPEMRREMMEMRNGCQRMMARMDAMDNMESGGR